MVNFVIHLHYNKKRAKLKFFWNEMIFIYGMGLYLTF